MVRWLERCSQISVGVREIYLLIVIGFSLTTLSIRYYYNRTWTGGNAPIFSDLDPTHFSISFLSIFEANEYWRFLTSLFLFGSIDEFILGSILIFLVCSLHVVYSQKSLLLCMITCMISSTLFQTFLLFFLKPSTLVNPGYGVVYGVLLTYISDMPTLWRCRIRFNRYLCPFYVTDKWITVIIAIQLLFAQFPGSIYAALTSFIGGLIYRLFLLCRKCNRPHVSLANSDYNTVPEEEDSSIQLSEIPIELNQTTSSSSDLKIPSTSNTNVMFTPHSNIDISSLTSNFKPFDYETQSSHTNQESDDPEKR